MSLWIMCMYWLSVNCCLLHFVCDFIYLYDFIYCNCVILIVNYIAKSTIESHPLIQMYTNSHFILSYYSYYYYRYSLYYYCYGLYYYY